MWPGLVHRKLKLKKEILTPKKFILLKLFMTFAAFTISNPNETEFKKTVSLF